MQGSFVLFLQTGPDGKQSVVSQGTISRVFGSTHVLCKIVRKGYTVNELMPFAQLEQALLFDNARDLAAFMTENNPPAASPTQPPPVDNQHVAPGCEQFTEPTP